MMISIRKTLTGTYFIIKSNSNPPPPKKKQKKTQLKMSKNLINQKIQLC